MISRADLFEKLEQVIVDEHKVMTFKILSREFQIHVNEAKKYMTDYLTLQKSKNINIHASYFLAGITEEMGVKSARVVIVTEDMLEKAKEAFAELTSCHIYSLSNGSSDKADFCKEEQNYDSNVYSRFAAIKHPSLRIQPPTLNKVNIIKTDIKTPTTIKQDATSVKHNGSDLFFKPKSKEREVKKTSTKKVEKENGHKAEDAEVNSAPIPEKPKDEPKSQKANTLASMWEKKDEKCNGHVKPIVKGKTKSPKKNTKNSQNNIMNLFSKQVAKNAVNPPKKALIETTSGIESESPIQKATEVVEKKSEKEISNKRSTKPAAVRNKMTKRRTKKSAREESDEEFENEKPQKKKRRRIQTFSDSSSESESEEAQDRAQRSVLAPNEPTEIPCSLNDTNMGSDDEEPIPPTPPVHPHTTGKKKVWVTVQKTFRDEDDFFVTKHVKELVTVSESDEDPMPQKKSPAKAAVQPNLFSYRKQASLTNFFKKS